jgi:hypothetical protein
MAMATSMVIAVAAAVAETIAVATAMATPRQLCKTLSISQGKNIEKK